MIPELGHFALILALCFALLQSFNSKLTLKNFSVATTAGQLFFLSFAMLVLIFCFLQNDMSVLYVQQHSHQTLPLIYRIGAAWGGHEGSLLLWCLILSGWTVLLNLVSLFFIKEDKAFFASVIAILGVISSGFIAFLLFTSNPFQRIYPTMPITGEDLTPVLQDPGLIFHPPMLYLGYVGFAIAFAFAIAGLLRSKFEKSWARHLRPWVIMPWSFLSCGIVLGSWWAYRELGWGGWWFWDPVENASLLPWLSGTALLHALIVTEKRDTFKGWTILLCLLTFSLSLLGTFLVRSGVLVSVHAFASDPTRGIFLLLYLTLLIGGGFTLFAFRIKSVFRAPTFAFFSRETFLLLNTVFLITAVLTISLGTLYPIVLDALNLQKISVGEPYFNSVFLPIILPMLLLIGLAPHVNWQQQGIWVLIKKLRWDFFLSLLLGFTLPVVCGFHFSLLASLGLSFSFWIMLATLHYLWEARQRQTWSLSKLSMVIAHLGIGILAFGITFNKAYSEERQIKIFPGETASLAGYQLHFQALSHVKQPNFTATNATFVLKDGNQFVDALTAEQRIYQSHQQVLSKPGILANAWRDLYVALGNVLPDNAWAVRLYYKPFVRWIWAGGMLLLLGGLLALISFISPTRRVSYEK